MKRIFTFLSVALFFASCLSESGGEASKPSTYIRYYYGGYNDKAAAFEETSDKGFILLSTVTITGSEAQAAKYKIKLTKTDEYGNVVWQQVYPDFSAASASIDYRAKGLQILSAGGYVITGEDIQSNGTSKALVMTVDANGTVLKTTSILPGTTPSVAGQAVAVNKAGNYLLLSTSMAPNANGDTEMLLGEMKKDDLSLTWTPSFKDYSAGQATLASRLFLDNSDVAFWAGTVTKNNVTGIRVIKTEQNSLTSYFDLLLLNPGYKEAANDFCRFGYGYAIVGSTDQKKDSPAPADRDILFKRLGEDGSVLSTNSFPLGDGKTLVDTQNDEGNSISSTQNGGLILLASVGSLAIGGRGDNDYLLININAFGEEVWRSHFGSRFRDTGVAVRQSSDGGFVVLGTTTQGGRDIMMLAKTNHLGQIE